MARPTLETIRGFHDFATTYQWDVEIIKPNVLNSTTDMNKLHGLCSSSTIPKATIDRLDVEIRGHKTSQPGIMKYDGSITLEFFETDSNQIQNFFTAWREICVATNTGAHNRKSDVQAQINLRRLIRSGESTQWTYELIGCWCTDFSSSQLQSTNSEAFKITAQIAYDYFKEHR